MYTRQLVEFGAALNYESLPAAVVARAKQCIRDYIGVVLGAAPIEESRMMAD